MEGLKEKGLVYVYLVKTPGVGEYRLPSEFGFYETAKKWFFCSYAEFIHFQEHFERSRDALDKLLSSAKADNHSKLCPLDKLYEN